MNGFILGNCENKLARTGKNNCPKKETGTTGLILTRLSASYPADAEAFNTGMQGWVITPGVNRMFPVTDICENTPAGGDPATSEVGFSGPMPVGINAYSEIYRVDAGDCLYKELMNLDKQQMRVFRIDQQNYVYGTVSTQKTGTTATEVFRGFDATVKVYRQKGTGVDPYGLFVAVYYSQRYENELQDMHAFELSELPQGLVGVSLLPVAGKAGVATVVADCSGSNYTAEFGDLWTVDMFANEQGTKPTSVAYNRETNTLTLSPAGAKYRIKGAAALAEKGIYGLDGLNVFAQV